MPQLFVRSRPWFWEMGSTVRRRQRVDEHAEPSRELVQPSPVNRTTDDEGLGARVDGELLDVFVARAVRAYLNGVDEEDAKFVGVKRHVESFSTRGRRLAV